MPRSESGPHDARRSPSTDGRIPSTGRRSPSTGRRSPSTDARTPSTDGRIPSTDGRIPSPREQLAALRLWLLGHEPEEMAGKLAVTDDKTELTLGAVPLPGNGTRSASTRKCCSKLFRGAGRFSVPGPGFLSSRAHSRS